MNGTTAPSNMVPGNEVAGADADCCSDGGHPSTLQNVPMHSHPALVVKILTMCLAFIVLCCHKTNFFLWFVHPAVRSDSTFMVRTCGCGAQEEGQRAFAS